MKQRTFIIDFDSTFIQEETLDVLAEVILHNHSRKETLLREIKKITQQGMNGELAFDESLKKRLSLLPISEKDIVKVTQILSKKISPSIKRNRLFKWLM